MSSRRAAVVDFLLAAVLSDRVCGPVFYTVVSFLICICWMVVINQSNFVRTIRPIQQIQPAKVHNLLDLGRRRTLARRPLIEKVL